MTDAPPNGVVAPILTPFNDDLSVATDLYAALGRTLLAQGCAALAPFGTTGEALSIAPQERVAALDALIAAGIDPARLVPGTGLTSLPETAALSRACLERGCAAVMTLPPFFYKGVPEEGLYRYFSELVARIDHPRARIVLYHIPQVAGVGLPVPLVARLKAAFPQEIVGIKDSSGDLDNTRALLGIAGLRVWPGSETPLPEILQRGGAGCVSATANLNAAPMARAAAALAAGAPGAGERHAEAAALRRTVEGFDFIATPKRLLALAAGEARWAHVRPPLVPAAPERAEALREALGPGFRPHLEALAQALSGEG